MTRVRISDRDGSIVHETQIQVGIGDINYGHHVGNERFLLYMQEVRMQWLNHLGYPNEISLGGGLGLFVVDVAAQYLAEVFFGDRLMLRLFIQDRHARGFDAAVEITNEQGLLVFVGKTGLVCVDMERKKAAALPQSFVQHLA